MKRRDAMEAIYGDLDRCVVVTIMGAVAAELQSIGHRPNFFYLQHAMGLASSIGTGVLPPFTSLIAPSFGTVVGEFGSRTQRTSSNTCRATSASPSFAVR